MKINIGWFLLVIVLISSLVFSLLNNFSTYEEKLCKDLSKYKLGCSEIYLVDNSNDIVFFRDEQNLGYALVNENFRIIDVKGSLDLSMFPNPNNEPLTWQAGRSIIWGVATEEIKSIRITSESNMQPNKFNSNGLWLWYLVLDEDEVNLPITINAYDKNGALIYGKE